MKFVLIVAGSLVILLTILSRVRSAQWWVRFTDFPRLQIAIALALVLAAFLILEGAASLLEWTFILALAGSFGFQCYRIFPYTKLAPVEVHRADRPEPDQTIRILISNVLMENRDADRLIALVRKKQPDLLLAVETDDWWVQQLAVLDEDYPHRIKQPQDNHYGLIMLSKLELCPVELRFLVEDDVPSVVASVRLRSGDLVDFYGVHPRPPEPQEDTEERDAELLIVARQVKAGSRPAIVAGDLNDVAWSHTTRLFQRISGSLDPRRGRGMFSTFHAQYPIFRWPLDHIFHEASFTLVRLERLDDIGSDHFPVLIDLCFEPAAEARQDTPEADTEDRKEASEKIFEGKEAASSRERTTQARVRLD